MTFARSAVRYQSPVATSALPDSHILNRRRGIDDHRRNTARQFAAAKRLTMSLSTPPIVAPSDEAVVNGGYS